MHFPALALNKLWNGNGTLVLGVELSLDSRLHYCVAMDHEHATILPPSMPMALLGALPPRIQ
jgi:hypothetical protein